MSPKNTPDPKTLGRSSGVRPSFSLNPRHPLQRASIQYTTWIFLQDTTQSAIRKSQYIDCYKARLTAYPVYQCPHRGIRYGPYPGLVLHLFHPHRKTRDAGEINRDARATAKVSEGKGFLDPTGPRGESGGEGWKELIRGGAGSSACSSSDTDCYFAFSIYGFIVQNLRIAIQTT